MLVLFILLQIYLKALEELLYYTSTKKLNINLLSFKDTCLNGYHIETNIEKDMKYLYISTIELKKVCVVQKLSTFSCGLYYTYISTIEMHVMVNQKFTNQNECLVWHDQLDDLYYTYITTIKMHVLVNQKFTNQTEFFFFCMISWVIVDLL